MKYRASVLILLLMTVLLLAFCVLPVPEIRKNNENRTMATFDMILHPDPDSVVYHDSPVERMEAALTDQVAFRETLVNLYLRIFNASEKLAGRAKTLFAREDGRELSLLQIGNYVQIGDTGYLTVRPDAKHLSPEMVAAHVRQLEKIRTDYPDMKLYVYFVTQAYDLPWFDGFLGMETADHYRDIRDALPEDVPSGRLAYRDLDDYMDKHFRTDHHWNHRGAYRGYEDILAMMRKDFDTGDALTPAAEFPASKKYGFGFLGRYAKTLGSLYGYGEEDFSFYEYDLPGYSCAVADPETLEETAVSEIGIYDRYRQGNINTKNGTNHYAELYGTAADSSGKTYDDTEYVFVLRNDAGNGRNLLICGDSYCRAVRDTLASHFSTTVTMDYRVFDRVRIDSLMDRYGIDTLLICSNQSLWATEEYRFMFREEE